MAPESAAAGAVPATALQRALQRFAKVEPRESAAVLTAFLLFFFVLGSYFAVRPVRETIGTLLGRDRVADLWLYTAIFSIAIVPIYGWRVARVRRSLLLPWIYGIVALILIGTGVFFATRGESPKPTIVPPPPAYEVIGADGTPPSDWNAVFAGLRADAR